MELVSTKESRADSLMQLVVLVGYRPRPTRVPIQQENRSVCLPGGTLLDRIPPSSGLGPPPVGLNQSKFTVLVIFAPLITFAEVHDGQDSAAAGLAQPVGRHTGVEASVAGAAVADPEPRRVLGL